MTDTTMIRTEGYMQEGYALEHGLRLERRIFFLRPFSHSDLPSISGNPPLKQLLKKHFNKFSGKMQTLVHTGPDGYTFVSIGVDERWEDTGYGAYRL